LQSEAGLNSAKLSALRTSLTLKRHSQLASKAEQTARIVSSVSGVSGVSSVSVSGGANVEEKCRICQGYYSVSESAVPSTSRKW